MSLNPHYFRAMNNIQTSIKDLNASDNNQTDRNESLIFMKGYILALAESELINSDECFLLRDELSRSFSGVSLRRIVGDGSQEEVNAILENSSYKVNFDWVLISGGFARLFTSPIRLGFPPRRPNNGISGLNNNNSFGNVVSAKMNKKGRLIVYFIFFILLVSEIMYVSMRVYIINNGESVSASIMKKSFERHPSRNSPDPPVHVNMSLRYKVNDKVYNIYDVDILKDNFIGDAYFHTTCVKYMKQIPYLAIVCGDGSYTGVSFNPFCIIIFLIIFPFVMIIIHRPD